MSKAHVIVYVQSTGGAMTKRELEQRVIRAAMKRLKEWLRYHERTIDDALVYEQKFYGSPKLGAALVRACAALAAHERKRKWK